jgi:MFS family permease
MLLADRLIRRYSSLKVLLWSFAIRVGLQAIILWFPTVPTLISMRAINAIAFSFFTVASTVFIAERSPQQSRATAMALFGMTLPALIKMLSGPLGGWAFDSFGAYWLYAIALVGNVLAGAILYFSVKEKPHGTTTLRANGA